MATTDQPVVAPQSEGLEDFLSLATHQLRSPLTTMSWTLDLLLKNLDSQSPEDLRHKLEVLNHSTHSLIDLVNDMLTVSHINHANFAENAAPHTLNQTLTTIISELTPLSEPKKISVHLNFLTEGLGERQYSYDEKWFRQSIVNVISNAIRYSPKGANVDINLTEDNGQVCIAVTDHGIGIPQADLDHIFDKFYRGTNVSNQHEPGSGLGLYITKAVVERWQGTINITSQENIGTTVTACLPLPPVT